jgi:hypothetical protein
MMKKETLEFYLSKGKTFGFVKGTNTEEYLGWISLSKLIPNPRFDEILTKEEQASLGINKNIETPYIIMVCELKRSTFEAEDYTKESDYRLNEQYFFKDLAETECFLNKMGFKLEDIKSISQIPSD